MIATIVIPARNEERNIARCLDGVFGQREVGDFEVILIDSESTDATVSIAKSYPLKLLHIKASEFHHARTRNLGASQAAGDYIVFLGADAFPAGNLWLRSLLKHFDDARVGAVYGRQIPKPEALPERAFFMNRRYGSEPRIDFDIKTSRNWFSTVNGAIRRNVWAATRFPEEFAVFEDLAIARTILSKGYGVAYEPQAAVIHSHNYSMMQAFRRYFDMGATFQRAGIWNSTQKNSMRSDGLAYLADELRYLRSQHAAHRIPYVVCYEAVRYAGLVLGTNERLVPLALKKKLTAHRIF